MTLADTPFAYALAETLFHFLWEGALNYSQPAVVLLFEVRFLKVLEKLMSKT